MIASKLITSQSSNIDYYYCYCDCAGIGAFICTLRCWRWPGQQPSLDGCWRTRIQTTRTGERDFDRVCVRVRVRVWYIRAV